MAMHPSFMLSDADLGLDTLGTEAMEGLMSMKYDPDDLVAQAKSYKDEGNVHFKKNKFDLAVENYTAGLKLNCDDKETNAQLHFNRAMAHFKRSNYRTALGDFEAAHKIVPPYFKAVYKAAECCLHLKRFDDCSSWCKTGLEIEPENKLLLATQEKCNIGKEETVKQEQKRLAALKRTEIETEALMTALKAHGVRFHPITVFTPDWFQSHCPQFSSPKFVSATDQSAIAWPILLSYPELKKQDFVESFNEQLSFLQLLDMVTGESAQRTDLDSAYTPTTVDVFYENSFKRKIVQVDVTAPLLTTMRRNDFIVLDGTPVFVVLCKNKEDFCSQFLQLYDNVDLLSAK